jgi:hypothetical protein
MNKHSINRISARPYVLYVLAVTILFLASVSSPFGQERPPSGPQTYELRCRGGGLAFKDEPAGPGALGRSVKVTINFMAGAQPSGSRKPTNLNSGQCSWVDRGFRKGEPTQIRLQKPGRDFANMQETLARSDRYWTFQVYNAGNGYLQSTRDMEWVPNN